MKKFLVLICIIFSFILTGCDKREENYVKYIYLTKEDNLYVMKLINYDFSSEEEKYAVNIYQDDNIYKLGIKVFSEENNSLRLCDSCLISKQLIYEIKNASTMLNNIKLPPATKIMLFTDIDFDYESFNTDEIINTPIYNFSAKDSLKGAVSVTDNTGKNNGLLMIHNNQPVKYLDKKQSCIFDMLTGSRTEFDYIFRNGQLSCVIKPVNVHYSVYENNLIVNIIIDMDKIKGIKDNEQYNQLFIQFLKSDMEYNVHRLFEDAVLNSIYNLHRYCEQQGKECSRTEVKITII